MLKIVKTFSF